eukprot:11104071-Karenia_brevis.AAC.1
MSKSKDKLLDYSRALTRRNKIHVMGPFAEPPTRENVPGSSTGREEGPAAGINSVTKTKGFKPKPGNPCGVPMPNFGGRPKPKPQ